jgi:hypothetical protein
LNIGKSATVNFMTKRYSLDPSLLWNSKGSDNLPDAADIMQSPIYSIKHLFKSGRWLNTYELPFFKNTYLEANQYTNWTPGRNGRTFNGWIKKNCSRFFVD